MWKNGKQHFETHCKGIFQFGSGATHTKIDEDNMVLLSEFATKKHTWKLHCIEKTLESSTKKALDALNENPPGIIQSVNGITTKMKVCMDKISIISDRELSWDCLHSKRRSLIHPSSDIAVDAETKKFHTEKDVNHTTLHVPRLKHREDESVTKTRFQFKVSEDVTMNVPFSCGATIIFNACLLTHRQNIESIGKMPMTNVALCCNEKFGHHCHRSLHRTKMFHEKN